MTDLNTMMRTQAREGLQTKLDAATTNGDVEAVRRIADDIAKLDVQTAPKAPPFGNNEILAEMNKLPWMGIDPKKSARALELGKSMNPLKFATAAAFSEALVKVVEEEFAPKTAAGEEGGDEGGEGNEDDGGEGDESDTKDRKPAAPKKRTDAPGEGDQSARGVATRRTSGPWTKLSEAPADVQKEVKRTADKFVPSTAKPEQREAYIKQALAAHFVRQKNGKK